MKVLKTTKLFSLLALIGLVAFSGCYYDNETELYQYADLVPCDATQITYSTDIVAILEGNCLACHSQTQAAALGGNIALANYAEVKAKVDDGSFYGSIIHQTPYAPMPTAGQKIADCDISRVKAWIDSGAPDN